VGPTTNMTCGGGTGGQVLNFCTTINQLKKRADVAGLKLCDPERQTEGSAAGRRIELRVSRLRAGTGRLQQKLEYDSPRDAQRERGRITAGRKPLPVISARLVCPGYGRGESEGTSAHRTRPVIPNVILPRHAENLDGTINTRNAPARDGWERVSGRLSEGGDGDGTIDSRPNHSKAALIGTSRGSSP
jgi:hypothetical protein